LDVKDISIFRWFVVELASETKRPIKIISAYFFSEFLMNVALVCFAFLPNSGSEPGVGWKWATTMAKFKWNVTVYTRKQHGQATINSGELGKYENIKVRSIGNSSLEAYFINRPIFLYMYIYVWQVLVTYQVWRDSKFQVYDVSHHLTYGGIRIPSLLGVLKTPSIYGPLGGGELAPRKLIMALGLKATLKEVVRYLANLLNRANPLVAIGFLYADRILIKTRENLRFIPTRSHRRTIVLREIGVSDFVRRDRTIGSTVKVLFVGRALYWKGGAMAIKAYAKLRQRCNATLTMVCSGPESVKWRRIAEGLGCSDSITWLEKVDKSAMPQLYAEHDIFLFPSLHDSSGNVVLESLASGLPVVCLDLGGPGEINRAAMGKTIEVVKSDADAVVAGLADAMTELVDQPYLYASIVASGYRFIEAETWEAKVIEAYQPFLNGNLQEGSPCAF
jgi:glycosyltransferase involved in cell wall biosynthesis